VWQGWQQQGVLFDGVWIKALEEAFKHSKAIVLERWIFGEEGSMFKWDFINDLGQQVIALILLACNEVFSIACGKECVFFHGVDTK